jgi:hypothetical protein
MQMIECKPQIEYLLTCSQPSLDSFELSRENRLANLRKEALDLINELRQTQAELHIVQYVRGRRGLPASNLPRNAAESRAANRDSPHGVVRSAPPIRCVPRHLHISTAASSKCASRHSDFYFGREPGMVRIGVMRRTANDSLGSVDHIGLLQVAIDNANAGFRIANLCRAG